MKKNLFGALQKGVPLKHVFHEDSIIFKYSKTVLGRFPGAVFIEVSIKYPSPVVQKYFIQKPRDIISEGLASASLKISGGF